MNKNLKRTLIAGTAVAALATTAAAEQFNIPAGDLKAALDVYARQTGTQLLVSTDAVKGVHTPGVRGEMGADAALSHLLAGTGFKSINTAPGTVGLIPSSSSSEVEGLQSFQLAQAAPVGHPSVETVTVTSSKLGGADVQSVPIAITAMSQEQLTATQTAGGPDLVKNVPNLTFSKTNFTGYNIQIRGIGTQAVSVTTDPAVAISFNDVPFLRNHFFEQEFFDLSQVEVLRGPQGTLYGRNATSGVVNLLPAKPSDHWEAMASVDIGNYENRRLEGMLNIPIVGDKLDLRVAGEWTKRDGYSFNEQTQQSTDGRDLWSGRVSLLAHPIERLTATAVWEHFHEDDDRLRSGKQLCKRDTGPSVVNGPTGAQPLTDPSAPHYDSRAPQYIKYWIQQGCLPVSLYSPEAFETPNGNAIPFISAMADTLGYIPIGFDPYQSDRQSTNLRVISSALQPMYKANSDTGLFDLDFNVTPNLTLVSQTGYNKDYLYSTQDFNRFNTASGLYNDYGDTGVRPSIVGQDGLYCDPQLGCSSRFVAQDLSQEHSEQFYQEVRLSSSFEGPLNFVVGGNYMKYWTKEDYYVFSNASTLFSETWNQYFGGDKSHDAPHIPFDGDFANSCGPLPASPESLVISPLPGIGCTYIDPNPLESIDGQGHNYFRSQNPYRLRSWAVFGETYYQIAPDVKLTGGLRFTDDRKSFDVYPSWTLLPGYGYPQNGTIDQEWREVTGRFVGTWTPQLDFTDQTLVYASLARGYKAGGANPPGVTPFSWFGRPVTSSSVFTHPDTFKPEFNNAFELGTKNTLFDGSVTLNADVFLYKYKDYQISQIVDRTAVNLNFDSTVKGAELESTWEPLPGLRFNLSGGYENATIDDGQSAIDLMDRTAGNPDWVVVKPFYTMTSNCVIPEYVANELIVTRGLSVACLGSYGQNHDPVTNANYVANPNPTRWPGYIGFDPDSAPNHGEGFDKDLSGNQLPNTPHFTMSLGGQYSMPLSDSWAGSLRGDFYWQSDSFARVFNDRPYDEIHGYTNLNLSLTFTNQDGWQAMAYVKNVLDTTAITGAFLNSDDSALTTNIFTTDPRLFGIRITKNW
jgi:outer membrane receptor protein involved in Fe transport